MADTLEDVEAAVDQMNREPPSASKNAPAQSSAAAASAENGARPAQTHWQAIAFTASLLSIMAYIPLLYGVYVKKRADQISILYLITALVSTSLWLTYASRNWIMPILGNSIVFLCLYLTLLTMKVCYDRAAALQDANKSRSGGDSSNTTS